MIKHGIHVHRPEIEMDRATAIQFAIEHASPEDVVLIAGKGHEDYQEIGQQRFPFSDLVISQKVMGIAA